MLTNDLALYWSFYIAPRGRAPLFGEGDSISHRGGDVYMEVQADVYPVPIFKRCEADLILSFMAGEMYGRFRDFPVLAGYPLDLQAL